VPGIEWTKIERIGMVSNEMEGMRMNLREVEMNWII
jgi:hypothetical protein